MHYTLTRSHRKTIAIYIRNGSVDVRAPLRMPKAEIDRFVASKEGWITDKLAIARERTERKESFALSYGDVLPLRGATFPIAAREGDRMGFDGEVFYLPPGLAPEQIKAACARIYHLLAQNYLPGRVLHFAQRMDVVPSAVKVSGAKTLWGSCSGKRSLNFSRRLMMGDDAVIAYVVVHELAHIKEMNHSARFWAIVEEILPDYRAQRAKLKELQRKLPYGDPE